MKNIFTVIVGGKAGEGVKKLAQLIAKTALEHGLHCFQSDDYQSLIKGGHNFSTVSISEDPIHNAYKYADLIICLDQLSYTKHLPELKVGGNIYYNRDEAVNDIGIGLPLTSLMKESYQNPANLSLAGLAIFFAHLGLNQEEMHSLIKRSYKKQIEENLIFADKCFPLVQPQTSLPASLVSREPSKLFTGNQAISLGAWLTGLDMYFAYPMTPASSILHYLASMSAKLGVKAIHAESELAAANMAVGAVVGGARAAIGSSGGGFALMQEAFSMAGITEAPLLCILSSRPGPATGVSTYTAQEDLYFALHQGHGEFDRIVASPDCIERAFSLAGELLALAWELQIPTILLTEKHLSESMQDITLPTNQIPQANPLSPQVTEGYKRYQFTEDGISPMLFPPSEEVIKWNSHEHLESGLRTDQAEAIVAMKDKRQRKPVTAACSKYQAYAIYGEGNKRIFAYGSTALEVREALKYLDGDYQLVVPIYLEPLPIEQLLPYCTEPAIVIEHNSKPRFAQFLKEKLGLTSRADILRYDGRAWDPIELADRIKEVDNA
ncbi:MAG: 2-oxoacid:acceptor oxidoreductase family protein [Candidatus Cloacimonadota bacterium]